MTSPSPLPRVLLQAVGSLKQHLPPAGQTLAACTVGEALAQLDLPRGVEFIPMIDGRVAHWDSPVRDGDCVQLVPVIGGG